MVTHVSINAQKLCCKLLTVAGFPSVLFALPKTGEIESKMCQQSRAIKCPDEIYPVDRRLEKIS